MADTKFDAKSFNPEAFGKYIENVPNLKRNELIKSRALTGNADIRNMFSSQTGTYYGRIPMFGNLDGEAQIYDGNTDIVPTSTTTFEQGVVVFGRMKAWEEKDFSYDITGGVDFMSNVAKQVSAYWEDIDQGVLLSILGGIFSMTGAENAKFVTAHTLDITGATGNDSQGNPLNKIGAGSLNTVAQQACGDNKSAFSLCIMHSAVATNLENLKLFKYLTYTDADGLSRDLSIGTWNGRSVLVDDGMPVDETGDAPKYTTYVLGDGAFAYENIGAKVPYEMTREALKAGGKDILISRQRKVLAPKGISFKLPSAMGTCPTNEHFATGANWELVHDAGNTKKVFDHKGIPIARIVSLG
jgi:hypothetical protein